MSCFYPLKIKTPTGEIVTVPCGRCYGCRLDTAKEWALRCVHESQMHEENCFLTLTYRDNCLPSPPSISKEEIQNFMKKLRRKLEPKAVRFFACGEYGEELGRPHYHVLLFGHDFEDKIFVSLSDPKKRNRFSKGESYKIYYSPSLEKIWKKGYNTVGEVNMQTAGYVARYVRKKITGDPATNHYKGLSPEFALMSRGTKDGGGIGYSWFMKYWTDCFPKDYVTYQGKKYKIPKYYDGLLRRFNREMFEEVKAKRKEAIREEDCVRLRQKEKYLRNVTKDLKRKLNKEVVSYE